MDNVAELRNTAGFEDHRYDILINWAFGVVSSAVFASLIFVHYV